MWRSTVQKCQDVPRHDITFHDLTWHSGTTLLPSSILFCQSFPLILLRASSPGIEQSTLIKCSRLSWRCLKRLQFLRSCWHSILTASIQSSCQEASKLCCHFFEINIQTSLNLQDTVGSRRVNFPSNWLKKNTRKHQKMTAVQWMAQWCYEISHLQRKLPSRCWTEASWGNLMTPPRQWPKKGKKKNSNELVTQVPRWLALTQNLIQKIVPRIFNFRIFSESLNWPRVM